MNAREKLKNKFNRSHTQKSNSSQLLETHEEEKKATPTKAKRNWVTVSNKVNSKDLQKISVNEDEGANRINLEAEMDKYLGGDNDKLEGFYESDEEIQFDSINPDSQASGANRSFFGKITSAFQSFAGNKVLTREDMEPILANFAQTLMDKNVNQDVANDICRQVEKDLMDSRTRSFTSVNATIKTSLEQAIANLLTPRRNIDILKEALAAKKQGQVYSIAFIGVNGVGKSTSLAKTAYYLKTKGNLKVMLAGCDNFRSGAIE